MICCDDPLSWTPHSQHPYRPPFILKEIKGIGDYVVGADGRICAGGTRRAPVYAEADRDGDVVTGELDYRGMNGLVKRVEVNELAVCGSRL